MDRIGLILKDDLRHGGYFALGSLPYGVDWEHDIEPSANPDAGPHLRELGDRFELTPWQDVDERLKLLDRRFGDLLVVAERPPDV